jgi:hypothetical protein
LSPPLGRWLGGAGDGGVGLSEVVGCGEGLLDEDDGAGGDGFEVDEEVEEEEEARNRSGRSSVEMTPSRTACTWCA